MLHSQHAGVPLGLDVSEDVAVVQFAGRRLLAARRITDLEIGDLVPGSVDVADDPPFLDLLVVKVLVLLMDRGIR